MEGIATAAEALRRTTDETSPYRLFPDDDGLLPCATSNCGDNVYWRTVGPPDRWPVVLYGRNDDWIEFPGTLTEYLTGLVTGDVPPPRPPP